MKIAVVLLSTFVATLAFPGDSLHSQFAKFKLDHGKQYSSLEELEHRMKVFQSNVEKIEKHNAEAKMGLHSYTMAINQFTDMTPEEFRATLTFKPMSKEGLQLHNSSLSGDLPDTVDWNKKGYVSGVKDQGQCGSCWAFSATDAMEAAFVKSGKKLMTLAPQLLVDCDHGSSGCSGGLMRTGFQYATSNGVMLEADYPYVATDYNTCKWDESKSQGKMSTYTFVDENEDALKKAVAEVGPISIALNADPIQYYGGGVLNNCWQGQPNHALLLVGYGTEGGEDYWLVKNSWGKTWGEAGYFKLARGSNQCCVGDWSVYPTAA